MTSRILILSGPSGCGKGTVIGRLREQISDVHVGVSLTTRPPRPGESHGTDYLFCDNSFFDKQVDAGEMLEWASYQGSRYGTPRSETLHSRTVLEMDVEGCRQCAPKLPHATTVFLLPPSLDVLADRLRGRGTEPEENIAGRLQRARTEIEIARTSGLYDHLIVNDDLDATVERIVALLS